MNVTEILMYTCLVAPFFVGLVLALAICFEYVYGYALVGILIPFLVIAVLVNDDYKADGVSVAITFIKPFFAWPTAVYCAYLLVDALVTKLN